MIRLWELAGLDGPPEGKLDDSDGVTLLKSSWRALLREASLWHRAGCPDPEWWHAQSPIERLALAEAGDAQWGARAAAIGAAAQSPQGAAEVLSGLDKGKASVHQRLVASASRAAAAAVGRQVG